MSRLGHVKGIWTANKDFNLPNLKAAKGEPLPSPWTNGVLRKYLRETQGKNCIKFVQDFFVEEKPKGILEKKRGRPPKEIIKTEETKLSEAMA